MTRIYTFFEQAAGLVARSRQWVMARMPASLSGQSDLTRAAAAGAILFAFAGAGLGAKGGFNAFRVDAAAAGATVSVGWGYSWLALALGGAAAGAAVGAGAAYVGRLWLDTRRAGIALLAVGAIGGIVAGATWGTAVARERVVQVRAQHAAAAAPTSNGAPRVTVINGPVRLDGSVARAMNVPLLAFMLIGGTLVGALAARGLAHPAGFARTEEREPVRDDLGRTRFRGAPATSGAH
jgi:hypothetical protein